MAHWLEETRSIMSSCCYYPSGSFLELCPHDLLPQVKPGVVAQCHHDLQGYQTRTAADHPASMVWRKLDHSGCCCVVKSLCLVVCSQTQDLMPSLRWGQTHIPQCKLSMKHPPPLLLCSKMSVAESRVPSRLQNLGVGHLQSYRDIRDRQAFLTLYVMILVCRMQICVVSCG